MYKNKKYFFDVGFMKKVFLMVFCAVGGVLIGAFANRLNTIAGCICFALGVVFLTASIAITSSSNYKR